MGSPKQMNVVSDFQMFYCRDQFYLIAHLQRHILREGWEGGRWEAGSGRGTVRTGLAIVEIFDSRK